MKKFIFIALLSLINLSVYAQVTSEVSYDANSKKMIVILTNHFDTTIILSPLSEGYENSFNACWFKATWKDANQKAISSYSFYVFHPYRGAYIPPKSSRTFKISVMNSHLFVKTVEALFHIEVFVRGKNGGRGTWWEAPEFTKEFHY